MALERSYPTLREENLSCRESYRIVFPRSKKVSSRANVSVASDTRLIARTQRGQLTEAGQSDAGNSQHCGAQRTIRAI